MTEPSQPVIKDTAPFMFRELAEKRLFDNEKYHMWLDDHIGDGIPIPHEHLEAAAMEAYVAFTECLDTWVETLIAGRPPTQPLVEWEHRDMIPHEDAPEAAASQERWR